MHCRFKRSLPMLWPCMSQCSLALTKCLVPWLRLDQSTWKGQHGGVTRFVQEAIWSMMFLFQFDQLFYQVVVEMEPYDIVHSRSWLTSSADRYLLSSTTALKTLSLTGRDPTCQRRILLVLEVQILSTSSSIFQAWIPIHHTLPNPSRHSATPSSRQAQTLLPRLDFLPTNATTPEIPFVLLMQICRQRKPDIVLWREVTLPT